MSVDYTWKQLNLYTWDFTILCLTLLRLFVSCIWLLNGHANLEVQRAAVSQSQRPQRLLFPVLTQSSAASCLIVCVQVCSQPHNKSSFGILQRCHSWHLNWKSFMSSTSFSLYEYCLISSLWIVSHFKNVIWSSRADVRITWMSQAFMLTHWHRSLSESNCRKCGRQAGFFLGETQASFDSLLPPAGPWLLEWEGHTSSPAKPSRAM